MSSKLHLSISCSLALLSASLTNLHMPASFPGSAALAGQPQASKSNKDSQKTAVQYFKRSQDFSAAGRSDLALVEITRAIRLKPDDISYLIARASIFEALERYAESERDLERALHITPKNAQDYYLRAETLYGLKRFQSALDSLSRAEKLGYSGKRLDRLYRLRGKILYKLGFLDRSIDSLGKAIAIKPTSIAYLYKGRCLKEKGDLQKALVELNEAEKLGPPSSSVLLTRALLLYRLKKLDQAKVAYKRWKTLEPGAASLYPDWRAFCYLGETDTKIDYYSNLIALSAGNNADPVYERALLYLALARYDEAAGEFQRYLAMTGWKGRAGTTAVCHAITGFNLCGRSIQAQKLVNTGKTRLDKKFWPYPIFRYLSGSLDLKSLIATSTDSKKLLQTRYFAAMNLIYHNQPEAALSLLKRIEAEGEAEAGAGATSSKLTGSIRGLDEFQLACSEADRLRHRLSLNKAVRSR
ncbi:MAG: tetratricopeptide repeat protein [Cyanobacteriota/Melainabacteria group bacterium]